jgi:hypothetical protein
MAYQIAQIHFQQDKIWEKKIKENQPKRELIELLDAQAKNFKKKKYPV